MRKKNMKKMMKTLLRDTTAVSEALGFVLIIAIVLSATSIYISQQIPELTKDFEARHAEDVSDDFSELDSLIDGIVLIAEQDDEKSAAATKSITMSPDRVPLLGRSPPGASLSFSSDDENRFKILPYVGSGAPPADPPDNYTIEESTTADFSKTNATANVDVSFDSIKLSRVAHSGDRILNDTIYTMSGEFHYGTVSITNNSKVYIIPGNYLKLYANTIFIDATSSIIADDRGYFGGDAGKIGNGPGFGNREGPAYNGSGGGGAGYAGEGGDGGLGGASIAVGDIGDIGRGGSDYGDNGLLSFDLGSGGGGGAYGEGGQGAPFSGTAGGDGGSGGGGVLLEAPLIRIAGTISADGFSGLDGSNTGSGGWAGGGGGGGSGGAITICGYEMNLSSATFSAQGGDGGDGGSYKGASGYGGGGGGAGAGGRIKIFYYDVSRYDNASLSHFVNGGSGGSGYYAGNGESGPDGIFNETETMYISTVPHYTQGYYNSSVYDTNYTTTCYGTISWVANTSAYTSLVIKVRTSISPNMTGAALWENCPAVENGQDISELSSAFDWHRYIQYRAELSTYDTTTTPVLQSVRINYSSYCAGEGGGNVVNSASGIIKFRSGYIYYPNQELVYEHGAVIRAQTSGSQKAGFVIHNPPITIGKDNGTPALQISLIDLSGSNDSYDGAQTSTVETIYNNDYTHLAGTIDFDNVSLNLSTAYASIWGNWFNKTLAESGLVKGNDYAVMVNESARTVVVAFYGRGDGVHLYLEKTTIAANIQT
jgi:hypothetical protein